MCLLNKTNDECITSHFCRLADALPERRQALFEVAGRQTAYARGGSARPRATRSGSSRSAPMYTTPRPNASAAMTAFSAKAGWSVHSSERVATVAALRGRDRLRVALNALGFELP